MQLPKTGRDVYKRQLHDYLLICFLHPTYPVGIRSTAYGYDILAPQVGDALSLIHISIREHMQSFKDELGQLSLIVKAAFP